MDEEAFTYAALRRVERQENTSPRLVRLETGFWERMGEHLATLRQAFQDQQEEDPTARRTVVLADELRNTQRLAESIWALREKKLVHAALAAARRQEGGAVPPEDTTPEERHLYEAVCGVLAKGRDEAAITDPFAKRRRAPTGTPVKRPVETASSAQVQAPEVTAVAAAPGAAAVPGPGTSGGIISDQSEGIGRPTPPAGEEGAPQAEAQADQGRGGVGASGGNEVELRVVQAIKDVPRFAGPDLSTYELAAGEIGNLPARAAQLLEERGIVRVLPGVA